MMQDILKSLSDGEYVEQNVKLYANVENLTYELKADRIFEDSIYVYNDKEQIINMHIYSNNNRIKINQDNVIDKNAKIIFYINTNNLSAGDSIDGKISILTDIGDIDIPFHYDIVFDTLVEDINKLNTINDYYDYLIKNYDKAFMLFVDKTILRANFMQDDFCLTVYEGLYGSAQKEVAFIEFFKAFNIDIVDIIPNMQIQNKYKTGMIYQSVDEVNSQDKNNILLLDDVEDKKEKSTYEDDKIKYKDCINLLNKIKDKDLISILAINSVRNGKRNFLAFNIYKNTIYNGTTVNGLFDKLLASIPNEYSEKLPLYVYKLYYEDKTFSFEQKNNLYENIINVFNEKDEVYVLYQNEIREYIIMQIYKNNINNSLVKIYNKIINKDMINNHNSKNILYLLRCHKVLIKNPDIKKIIVKYKQLNNETKYDVIKNIAFVPLFFDSYILFFEDNFGNRYFKQDIIIMSLFHKKNLENYCLEKYPDYDIINVSNVIDFCNKKILRNIYDVRVAKDIISTNKFNDVICNILNKLIIDFYYNKYQNGEEILTEDVNYVLNIDFKKLDFDYKKYVSSILLYKKEYINLFNLIYKYDINLLDSNSLVELYHNIITNDIEISQVPFINEVLKIVQAGYYDETLLTYLSNNYEGSINDMIDILKLCDTIHIDTTILSKKLLEICLSLNHNKDLDYIYNVYITSNDTTSNLQFAYLTKKCADYFLKEKPIDNNTISNLTSLLIVNLKNLDKVPIIYILTFTKYISELEYLNDNDMRRVLIKSMNILLESDMVFAYFKKLNKHIKIPYSIMSKEYIEYHTDKDFIPKVIFSVNGIDSIRDIELYKVYKNIYSRSITVFKNEIVNYRIYDSSNPKSILKVGTLTYEEGFILDFVDNNIKDSFSYINSAIEYLDTNNYEALRKVVNKMVINQKVTEELFNIDDEGENN